MFSEIHITDKISKDKQPIAKVKDEKIYLTIENLEQPSIIDHGKEVTVTNKSKLDPLYFTQTKDHIPNRYFIAGGSGCGKSYIAHQIAKDYLSKNKNNKCILFSALDAENFEKLPNFHKIKVDETLFDDPIELDELHDALVIFDDIQCFGNKAYIKEIERVKNNCLNAGRHHNISTIVTAQDILNGALTKTNHNASLAFIGFPQGSGKYQFEQYLKRYVGLDKHNIHKILHLPSRWVMINKTPSFVLHEKGCFLL